MSLRLNIGEAKRRWSEVIAAVYAGEDVVICRYGKPQVRLELIGGDAKTNPMTTISA